MNDPPRSPETPSSTQSGDKAASPVPSLLGRNLLWALGSLAGAVAGAIVCTVLFAIVGFALSLAGQYVFQLADAGAFAERAGGFAAAGGVLIGGVIGAFAPLAMIGEGEQRVHEKVLALIVGIGIFFLAWRLNADTVFSAGWMGLAVVVASGGILGAAFSLVAKKA